MKSRKFGKFANLISLLLFQCPFIKCFQSIDQLFGLATLTDKIFGSDTESIITASLAGPFLLRADPFDVAGAPMTPPLEDGHWLGTDYVGRDIFTGIVYGGRATLAVALAATAFNLVIGLSVGALAGYYQGATNTLLMKITEFFQVLPPLLFAMVIVSLFSPSAGMIAVAIGLVTWPSVWRRSTAPP